MPLTDNEKLVKKGVEALRDISEELKGIKKALSTDTGQWISGEKLPETDENVLVWFEYFRYGDYNCPFQTYGISQTYNGEWSGFVNGSSGWTDLKIIAWQPLPEPPKEREV
jgi:hypothetical protein